MRGLSQKDIVAGRMAIETPLLYPIVLLFRHPFFQEPGAFFGRGRTMNKLCAIADAFPLRLFPESIDNAVPEVADENDRLHLEKSFVNKFPDRREFEQGSGAAAGRR